MYLAYLESSLKIELIFLIVCSPPRFNEHRGKNRVGLIEAPLAILILSLLKIMAILKVCPPILTTCKSVSFRIQNCPKNATNILKYSYFDFFGIVVAGNYLST